MERQTRQRQAIIKVLERERRPLTAEEIHRRAKDLAPRLGITTVYRSIKDMLGDGALVGVRYPGQPTRYEVPAPEHIHFICNRCRQVHDLPMPQADVNLRLPEGFIAQGQELIVFGICPDCSPEPDAGNH